MIWVIPMNDWAKEKFRIRVIQHLLEDGNIFVNGLGQVVLEDSSTSTSRGIYIMPPWFKDQLVELLQSMNGVGFRKANLPEWAEAIRTQILLGQQ